MGYLLSGRQGSRWQESPNNLYTLLSFLMDTVIESKWSSLDS